MKNFLNALFVITASALSIPTLVAGPVPINDYHGDWSATAGAYAAGSVVTHAGRSWLSLAGGNTSTPGAAGAAPQWRLLGEAKTFLYKPGDRGPGGGMIFFIDRDDEFPGFDYLEAAPDDLGTHAWCDQTNVAIPEASSRAVGLGKANTQAMLAVCATGAANAAVGYRGPNGKDDWFLPSLGEAMLIYRFAVQSGKLNLGFDYIWSSSESAVNTAWYQPFDYGALYEYHKDGQLHVRPIRAFAD